MKDEYKSKADDFLSYLLNLETTNLGLVWTGSSTWGSLRYAGNFAMFAMQAGFYGLQSESAFKFAEQQMNYALGDSGHSYVCGFGSNPPKRPVSMIKKVVLETRSPLKDHFDGDKVKFV